MRGHSLEHHGRRTVIYHVNPGIFHALRSEAFDVVAIAGYSMFTSQAAILWCRMTGTPYLLFGESHHQDHRPGWVRRIKAAVLPLAVRPAAGILATGTLSGEYFESYGASADRIFRFANTPDVDRIRRETAAGKAARDRTRTSFGIEKNDALLLHVGRLLGVKAVDDVIRALGRIEDPTVKFLVVGDGAERAALEAQAEREAPGRVVFAGFRQGEELANIYAAGDVFVLGSRHEPWGVVVGEAMAAGLPVVLSDRVGAGRDLLRDGENGRVFPADDVAALVAAIEDVVSDRDRMTGMGRRSDEIMDDWTYETSVADFARAARRAVGRE